MIPHTIHELLTLLEGLAIGPCVLFLAITWRMKHPKGGELW